MDAALLTEEIKNLKIQNKEKETEINKLKEKVDANSNSSTQTRSVLQDKYTSKEIEKLVCLYDGNFQQTRYRKVGENTYVNFATFRKNLMSVSTKFPTLKESELVSICFRQLRGIALSILSGKEQRNFTTLKELLDEIKEFIPRDQSAEAIADKVKTTTRFPGEDLREMAARIQETVTLVKELDNTNTIFPGSATEEAIKLYISRLNEHVKEKIKNKIAKEEVAEDSILQIAREADRIANTYPSFGLSKEIIQKEKSRKSKVKEIKMNKIEEEDEEIEENEEIQDSEEEKNTEEIYLAKVTSRKSSGGGSNMVKRTKNQTYCTYCKRNGHNNESCFENNKQAGSTQLNISKENKHNPKNNDDWYNKPKIKTSR